MSLGYLVLIIYDLYCKCLECVFVKVMAVLVICKLVQSSRRCKNTSAWFSFLDGNVVSSSRCVIAFQSQLQLCLSTIQLPY